VVYMLFVVITCVTFILGTHPQFRSVEDYQLLYDSLMREHGNPKIALAAGTEMVPSLLYIHNVSTVYFTIDLLMRIVTCPIRKMFFKHSLNIVDLVIVISLVVTFVFRFYMEHVLYNEDLLWIYIVMQALLVLRLLRLFRFARHFTGLKILYLALRASIKELGLLCLTMLITTALFGGLIYYAEFSHPENISSVPIGIWWAIVTLTTVGYGDQVPVTTAGYIIGALCGMCGLLLLSMPIAVIATNFNEYYSQNKIREKQLKRKKTLMAKLRSLFKFDNSINAIGFSGGSGSSRPVSRTHSARIPNGDVKATTQIDGSNTPVTSRALTLHVPNGSTPASVGGTPSRNSAFKKIILKNKDKFHSGKTSKK